MALGLVGILVGGGLALVLRGGATATPRPQTPVASGSPAPTEVTAVPSASVLPTLTGPTPPPGARASIDPTILSILPSTVGGLPVREFPDAAQQAAADPSLGQNVASALRPPSWVTPTVRTGRTWP